MSLRVCCKSFNWSKGIITPVQTVLFWLLVRLWVDFKLLINKGFLDPWCIKKPTGKPLSVDFLYLKCTNVTIWPAFVFDFQAGWLLLKTGIWYIFILCSCVRIHPRDKQDVAYRLTLGARAVAYNETDVAFLGPFPIQIISAKVFVNITYDQSVSVTYSKDVFEVRWRGVHFCDIVSLIDH